MQKQRQWPSIDPFFKRLMIVWAVAAAACAVFAFLAEPAKAGELSPPSISLITVCNTYGALLQVAKLRNGGSNWNQAAEEVNRTLGRHDCKVETGTIYEWSVPIGPQLLVANQAYSIYEVTVMQSYFSGLISNEPHSGYSLIRSRSYPI